MRRMNALGLLLALTGLLVLPAAGATDLAISTVDSGGGTSVGGTFELSGTIGQPDAGAMSQGSFELQGGFWPSPSGNACLGDTNGDGEVDVDDLVGVILDWDTDGTNNGGDIDGSGNVDVDDLVTVILAWGAC